MVLRFNYLASQMVARNVIVGRRFPPKIVLRAGDDRTVQIHDILPSDTSFKLLVVTCDLYDEIQSTLVKALAEQIAESALCIRRPLNEEKSIQMVEPMIIVRGKKGEVRWTDVPAVLRSHWSK